MNEEINIPFRLLLQDLPRDGFEGFEGYSAIVPGIQRGAEVELGADAAENALGFAFTLRVRRHADSGRPNFLGDYAYGTPKARFLYVCWCGEKAGERSSFRRMKVSLETIEWQQIEAVAASEEDLLEAAVSAQDRQGRPACASVPLLGDGWHIAKA
ncbi:MAG: DUF5990 family protein [Rhodovibrionaceae bacterium]